MSQSAAREFYGATSEPKGPKTKPGNPGIDAVIGEWQEVQARTYKRWANRVLVAENEELANIFEDLRSGVILVKLVARCSHRPLPKFNKAAKLKIQRLENLSLALAELKEDKVALVNIGAEDIEAGAQKSVLALLWALILQYQIRRALIDPRAKAAQQAAQEKAENEAHQNVRFQDEEEKSGDSAPDLSPAAIAIEDAAEAQLPQDMRAIKDMLLSWVSSQIAHFGLPAVHNFTSDWQDGRALCALTESVEAGSLNMSALPEESGERISMAIDVANRIGIQKLLEAEDIASRTDQHSMMVYISYFRDYYNDKLAQALAEAQTAEERAAADRMAALLEEEARAALHASLEAEKREREEEEKRRAEAEAEAERQRQEEERLRLEEEQNERELQAKREAAMAAAAAAELAAAQASLDEKLERERAAEEAKAQLEQLEREERARQERHTLERERKAKEEQDRLDQERAEREERERLQRERAEREAAEEAKQREEAIAIFAAMEKEGEKVEQERIAAEKHAEAVRLFNAQTMRGRKEGTNDLKNGESNAMLKIDSRGGIMCLATDGIPIISPNGRVDLGLIRLCVWYDNVRKLLMVGLYNGLCLPAMDSNGFSDPFIKLRLVPERKTKKWKSKVLKKTLNPVFNQTHTFSVLPEQLDDTRLLVDCYDYDFASTDDFMGTIDIPLAGVPQVHYANLSKQFHADKLETWVDTLLTELVRWYAVQPEDTGFTRPSGSIPFENDCWKYPDGSSKLPTGHFQLGDGSISNSFRYNGRAVFTKLTTGARYLDDATLLRPDRTVVLPSGAIVRLDGNLRMPDGSVKAPNWAIPHHPLPAGFMQLPDFSFTGPHDGQRLPVVEPPGSNTGLSLGCIKLSARFYSRDNKVLIKVERAAGLPAMDRNGFSDPYVIVEMVDTIMGPSTAAVKQNSILQERERELEEGVPTVGGQRTQVVLAARKTTVVKKSLNPRWDTEFYFAVNRRQLSHRMISIEVWDWDLGSSDDFMGGLTLNCLDLKVDVKASECVRWYALQPRDPSVSRLFLPPAPEPEKPLPSILF